MKTPLGTKNAYKKMASDFGNENRAECFLLGPNHGKAA